MVSVDGSIVLQIVNFLLLIWIMNMVLYKPIRKILLERKDKVTGLQSDIDGSADQVKSKEDAYAEGVRQARAAGQKEKEALMEAAAEEEKAIIGKINESAQAELERVMELNAEIAEELGLANQPFQLFDFVHELRERLAFGVGQCLVDITDELLLGQMLAHCNSSSRLAQAGIESEFHAATPTEIMTVVIGFSKALRLLCTHWRAFSTQLK